MTPIEKRKSQELKVGDHAVVFNYTNTTPETSGEVCALSEHFVEIWEGKERMFRGKKKWFPRDRVEKIISQ